MTVDIRLQMRAMEILEQHLRKAGVSNGALVVMEAGTGDVIAAVSAPLRQPARRAFRAGNTGRTARSRALRAVSAGFHFKLVTAIAALRGDTSLTHRTYQCRPLGDGRCGIPSRDGIAPSKTISAIMRTAPSIWSAPSQSPATRTLRSLECTTWAPRRWRRRPTLLGLSTGDPVGLAPGAAVRGIRAGSGAGHAVQNGACGGRDRGGRPDAARPLDRR